MTSYLCYVISYCNIFEDFPRERNVDFKMEPTFVWYLDLWRHKSQYNFYAIENGFMFSFKKMIHGPAASRLSLEASSFLTEKGIFETLEDFGLLRLFGFQGKPFLLPFYVSDRLFVIEVCESINNGHTFSTKKERNNSLQGEHLLVEVFKEPP
jgi:hypothetical protein